MRSSCTHTPSNDLMNMTSRIRFTSWNCIGRTLLRRGGYTAITLPEVNIQKHTHTQTHIHIFQFGKFVKKTATFLPFAMLKTIVHVLVCAFVVVVSIFQKLKVNDRSDMESRCSRSHGFSRSTLPSFTVSELDCFMYTLDAVLPCCMQMYGIAAHSMYYDR